VKSSIFFSLSLLDECLEIFFGCGIHNALRKKMCATFVWLMKKKMKWIKGSHSLWFATQKSHNFNYKFLSPYGNHLDMYLSYGKMLEHLLFTLETQMGKQALNGFSVYFNNLRFTIQVMALSASTSLEKRPFESECIGTNRESCAMERPIGMTFHFPFLSFFSPNIVFLFHLFFSLLSYLLLHFHCI
jgi:hypothetical protein